MALPLVNCHVSVPTFINYSTSSLAGRYTQIAPNIMVISFSCYGHVDFNLKSICSGGLKLAWNGVSSDLS